MSHLRPPVTVLRHVATIQWQSAPAEMTTLVNQRTGKPANRRVAVIAISVWYEEPLKQGE